MRTYSLYAPAETEPRRAQDKAKLVPEGFAWGAFFFGCFWFWVKGFFLAGSLVLGGQLALIAGLTAAGVAPQASLGVWILFQILVGFEADALLRWTYGVRGWAEVAVVAAKDRDEAERSAFGFWLAESEKKDAPAAPAPRPDERGQMPETRTAASYGEPRA